MKRKKLTALVVDDTEAIRTITAEHLRLFGISHVCHAENGAKALNVLAGHQVDIILSDWNMPVMNGLELLAKARVGEKQKRGASAPQRVAS